MGRKESNQTNHTQLQSGTGTRKMMDKHLLEIILNAVVNLKYLLFFKCNSFLPSHPCYPYIGNDIDPSYMYSVVVDASK